ncbi:Uma2 family endonuclease [Pseudanabaena sp. FACHB-1277]|uniref:Uma2 family endonuclease n=1 Tax=Pseudanabaena cinerea FACHB-1277 TaxID=2949581 RepID=A0A926Z6E0_9CYAN|nr:Uma2 family endonuclease [Pseudanabaena cinerea]MBD2148609.1 Uma2 family endonuclease [Pseudanabaena cinerea FACHB-1277]
MIATPKFDYITPDQYLEMEEQSEIKHEYIDGYVYAMAGANDPHVTIASNAFMMIRNHLRGSGCRVYISDMKARIDSLNRFYYPDVMVTCDPRDTESQNQKRYPKLIIEVLSKSTEGFDRGDKFADYQQIETLEEYVLVNTKRQRLDCFCRNQDGLWLLKSYSGEQDKFQLSSINFEGKFAELYEDVKF